MSGRFFFFYSGIKLFSVQKSKNKSGLSVWLRFSIAQHSINIRLLEGLVFFGCGYVVNYAQRSVSEFILTRTDHVGDNIIPLFFDKDLIAGSKYSNYLNFKSVSENK